MKTFEETPPALSNRKQRWSFLLDGKARLIEAGDYPMYADWTTLRMSIYAWVNRHHKNKRAITSLRDEGLYVQVVLR